MTEAEKNEVARELMALFGMATKEKSKEALLKICTLSKTLDIEEEIGAQLFLYQEQEKKRIADSN